MNSAFKTVPKQCGQKTSYFSDTKVAIVSGGSHGLGRNTVLNLAKRGVNSIFTYNSNRAEADPLEEAEVISEI